MSMKERLGWVKVQRMEKVTYPRPQGVDEEGNLIFMERISHRLRLLEKDGTLSTLREEFKFPSGGCLGKNQILIADRDCRCIYSFENLGKKNEIKSIVAHFLNSDHGRPCAVCIGANSIIYATITDNADGAHCLVKIENQRPKIIAGKLGFRSHCDGVANEVARFSIIYDIKLDPSNGTILIADGNRVRCYDPKTNRVSTIAGSGCTGALDGSCSEALFHTVRGLAVNSDGTIYLSDFGNGRVRLISSDRTTVSTLAGADTLLTLKENSHITLGGLGNEGASLYCPFALALDEVRGILFVGTADDAIASITIPSLKARRRAKRIQLSLLFWLTDHRRAFIHSAHANHHAGLILKPDDTSAQNYNTKRPRRKRYQRNNSILSLGEEAPEACQDQSRFLLQRSLSWLAHAPFGASDVLHRVLEFLY